MGEAESRAVRRQIKAVVLRYDPMYLLLKDYSEDAGILSIGGENKNGQVLGIGDRPARHKEGESFNGDHLEGRAFRSMVAQEDIYGSLVLRRFRQPFTFR
jgi:hypothetical protein